MPDIPLAELVTVTTTATLRPELMEITYSSLFEQVGSALGTCPARINIDIAPPKARKKLPALQETALRYFPGAVFRVGDPPGFATAVKWCWSELTTPYVLNVEDDWRFVRQINLYDMIRVLEQRPELHQVRFSRHTYSSIYKLSLWPSLWRASTCTWYAERFNDTVNPESQLRSAPWCNGKEVSASIGGKPAVVDIGRAWAKQAGVARPVNKGTFVRWEIL